MTTITSTYTKNLTDPTVSAFIVVNGATHTYAPHPEPPTYQFHGSYQAMPPAAVVVFMFSIKPVVPVMGPQGPGNFFFQWWSCKGL